MIYESRFDHTVEEAAERLQEVEISSDATLRNEEGFLTKIEMKIWCKNLNFQGRHSVVIDEEVLKFTVGSTKRRHSLKGLRRALTPNTLRNLSRKTPEPGDVNGAASKPLSAAVHLSPAGSYQSLDSVLTVDF